MPEEPLPGEEDKTPAGEGGEIPPETPPEGGETPPKGGETPPEGGKPPADEEPPVRKKPIDYILERKNRQIEKLKNKEEEPDDGVSPEDIELVSKVIDKKYGSTFDALQETEFKAELTGFITDNPEFKPFQSKIEKWAKHPAYANLPLETVAHAACGKELLKLGAEKARKADEEAAGAGTGGSSGRTPDGSSKKKVWDMTPEEFKAEEDRVRRML